MNGTSVGSVKRLMIDKLSGRVAYTVASFGGFLGIGTDEYTIPWNKLTYDPSLGGFRTDINAEQLKGSPTFYRENNYSWSDRQREETSFRTGTPTPIGPDLTSDGMRAAEKAALIVSQIQVIIISVSRHRCGWWPIGSDADRDALSNAVSLAKTDEWRN